MTGGHFEFVAMGNPLLDMQLRNGEKVLEKYSLKANDAILVAPEQESIYDYVKEHYEINYVAGGAAQNAARAAQYVLPPKTTAYIGCVGKDDLADQLRAANAKEGLESAYQVAEDAPTGSCAVVLTGTDRSLVTRLGAAEKFAPSHLDKPEINLLLEGAKMFYLGGFFLTHGEESAIKMAKVALKNKVPFTMNLSAPFIAQFFTKQVDALLPYVSVLFGNETEFEAYGQAHNLPAGSTLAQIAQHIADLPTEFDASEGSQLRRLVICTHGSEPTIVAQQGQTTQLSIPTDQVPKEQIVDTNGAGDAFAGGALGALLLGKSTEEAVKAGQKLGRMCIGQDGPQLKFPKEQVL